MLFLNSPDNHYRMNTLHLIIFSKDRACQLDSLLRSIRDNFIYSPMSITVLYKTSTPAFAAGYDLLKKRTPSGNVAFCEEKSFEADAHEIIKSLADDSLILFLVDDNILFRACNPAAAIAAFTNKHLFISLRASRAYSADVAPEFLHAGLYLEWKWNYSKRHWVTWNYPFSVDGNIYHVCHIKKVIDHITFSAPNSFEGRMHTYRHAWWVKRISKALALPEAVVFNNPLNKVQTEGETWHQSVSVESLNDSYLNNMVIDNKLLYTAKPTATHFSVPLLFVNFEG